jgi:thiol-disulfide isomerase/thioredoxin
MSFSAVDLATGDERSVDDVRGAPTLLAGWATWCVPCERELPELEAALPELTAAGVQVVAVNVDASGVDESDVLAMIERLAPSLESWRDVDSTLLGAYESFLMPFSVLLDADGDVVRTWNGASIPTTSSRRSSPDARDLSAGVRVRRRGPSPRPGPSR